MPTNRLLAALAALALATGVARATPPTVLTYSGFLMDSAGTTPLTGVHDFNFRFYTLATGGTQIGTGDITVSSTVGSDGFFSVVIDVTSIANNPLFQSQMYMSVRVDADVNPMTPRVQVTSAPGALSVPYGGITDFPTTPCGAGQFATGFDVNGNLVCASAQGGVTSVNAGTGVAVSATTGAVTVSANLAPAGGESGSSTAIARADHLHDARYVQPGALSAVGTVNTAGNPVDWSQLKNVPTPIADGADAVGLTAVAVGSGLSGDGSSGSPILLPACASAGYALKWNGSAYACAADVDTNTTYAAGTGLALVGTTFSIASGGVAPAMLAAGAVGSAALANGAVTAAKLAPDAVTSIAIAAGSIWFDKLNQNGCAANEVPRWDGAKWSCSMPLNDAGCSPGQVLKWNGTEFNCQIDVDTSTSYLAGPGLSLTGSTFSVAGLGVTTGMLADGAVTLAKLSGTGCAAGQAPVYASPGGFTCQPVVTSVSVTSPLTISTSTSAPVIGLPSATNVDSGFVTSVDFVRFNAALQVVDVTAPLAGEGTALRPLYLTPCLAGQILRTDAGGAGWTCDYETPGTVTQVTTGAGLTGGPITSSGTISIAAKGVTPAMIENGAGGQVLMTNASNNAAWLGISGDATLGSGGVLTLGTSGVAAGTYNNSSTTHTPFTVDAKGRITSTGAAVTIAPAFSSITGRPTTLAGYGVTDVQVTGGMSGASVTATGNITTGGQFAYSAARTFTKFIGAVAFQPLNSSGGVLAGTYWYNGNAAVTSLFFHADPAAYVPNGASIVSIRCDRYDGNDTASHTGQVYVWRRPISSTGFVSMGSANCAATTGTVAAPELNTSCLLTFGTPLTMDQGNFQYQIGIDNNNMPAASTSIRFYGCLVTYTATGVTP